MRLIPVSLSRALLVGAVLAAAPLASQRQVVVESTDLHALEGRLQGFAAALPAAERQAWDALLLRAALAPADDAEDVRIAPVLLAAGRPGTPGGMQAATGEGPDDGGTPGLDQAVGRAVGAGIVVQGGRTPSAGIVVQGGRAPSGIVVQGGRAPSGIVVQGGRTPAGGRPGVEAGGQAPRPNPTGDGTVAIGPKQDDPGAPRPGTGVEAIGPKQDDPGTPRPGARIEAIGPKQDDPTAPPVRGLSRGLAALAADLPEAERGVLDWLLARAAAAPEGAAIPPHGTPGGLPPGMSVSLRQALGIDVLAIGPKQDDPAPPPPAQRWLLRF